MKPTEDPAVIANAVMEQITAKKSSTKGVRPQSKAGRDNRRTAGEARRVRRVIAQKSKTKVVDRSARPHARLGGAKLVKSDTQRQLEERRVMRQYLSRVKTARLIVECPEAKYVASVPGLGNVWQLSQTTRDVLLGIPGMGPARRRKLRAYLVSKQIPVAWEA
jgi:hypothetical protein